MACPVLDCPLRTDEFAKIGAKSCDLNQKSDCLRSEIGIQCISLGQELMAQWQK